MRVLKWTCDYTRMESTLIENLYQQVEVLLQLKKNYSDDDFNGWI